MDRQLNTAEWLTNACLNCSDRKLIGELPNLCLHLHTLVYIVSGTSFGRQNCPNQPEEREEYPYDPKNNVPFLEGKVANCEDAK
jgi:hypothetical protein